MDYDKTFSPYNLAQKPLLGLVLVLIGLSIPIECTFAFGNELEELLVNLSKGKDNIAFNPYTIAVDSSDNVYVNDYLGNHIQKFTGNGTFIAKWGSFGNGMGEFGLWPSGIAVDSSGNVYVADSDNDRVQKFTGNGDYITKWGSPGGGIKEFNWPNGIAVDSSGNVYVVDAGNHRVQKFTGNWGYITQWDGPDYITTK